MSGADAARIMAVSAGVKTVEPFAVMVRIAPLVGVIRLAHLNNWQLYT